MDAIKTQREYEALDKEIKDATEKEQDLRRDLQKEQQSDEELKGALEKEELMIQKQEEDVEEEQSKIKLQDQGKEQPRLEKLQGRATHHPRPGRGNPVQVRAHHPQQGGHRHRAARQGRVHGLPHDPPAAVREHRAPGEKDRVLSLLQPHPVLPGGRGGESLEEPILEEEAEEDDEEDEEDEAEEEEEEVEGSRPPQGSSDRRSVTHADAGADEDRRTGPPPAATCAGRLRPPPSPSAFGRAAGRKVRAPQSMTPGNPRAPARAESGEARTESATENIPPAPVKARGPRRPRGARVRVKRRGKSPPPARQRAGHGKPRQEQSQAAGGCSPPGRNRHLRVGCTKRAGDAPLQRDGGPRQNPAYRSAPFFTLTDAMILRCRSLPLQLATKHRRRAALAHAGPARGVALAAACRASTAGSASGRARLLRPHARRRAAGRALGGRHVRRAHRRAADAILKGDPLDPGALVVPRFQLLLEGRSGEAPRRSASPSWTRRW